MNTNSLGENSGERLLPQNNLELPKDYLFQVLALLGYYKPFEDGGESFFIETANTASETINKTVKDIALQVKNEILLVIRGVPPFIFDPSKFSENPNATFSEYERHLTNLSDYALQDGKTLILGFSSMGGYELLPYISAIIKKLKTQNPNFIFIMGGADFNALPNKDFLNNVFDYGIDIVNIGGAKEFTEFIGNISLDDSFSRDKNGFLNIKTERSIPQNLIFASQKNELFHITKGEKINATYYFDTFTELLHFTIPNNPCLNNCGYCANYIHSQTPLKNEDVDQAIEEFNTCIKTIETPTFAVEINNPNPMQYIDKFSRFMQNIDLSRVKEFGFFGDFIGLGSAKLYEKTSELLESILEKWPHLIISIHFGIDALHHDGDGEFLGRSQGHKLLEEPKYVASLKNFDLFYERFKNNSRVHMPFSLIFHPNMEIGDYYERIEIIKKYFNPKSGICLFPLVPHPNTQIEKDHAGFFIPEFETIHAIDMTRPEFSNLNHWGAFYLNSSLIDIFSFLNCTGFAGTFEAFIEKHNANGDYDHDVDNFLEIVLIIGNKIEEKLEELNSLNGNSTPEEKENYQKYLSERIDRCICYIDFVLYREKYIASINPDYASEKLDDFINKLTQTKDAFIEIQKSIQ